ncbi:MAG: aldose epimerase family protein [Puniceicoccaceae bacterium]
MSSTESTPTPSPDTTPTLTSRPYGDMPDGRDVTAWTLRNAAGMELEVLTYGGIVSRLIVPDGGGERRDVVLGFNDLAAYLNNKPFAGATVGRIAGRVPDGIIEVEGKPYHLLQNDGTNHLHGGAIGFDKRLWSAEGVERADGAPSVRLSYTSPAGEEGYPGEVLVAVTYTVTQDNAFLYETEVTASEPTPVSLTHHAYFNLAGEGSGSIEDHELVILSDSVAAADEEMTLLGGKEPVAGKPCDLSTRKRVGDIIPGIWQEHGDLYWLGEAEELRPVARLFHPPTGQVMEVSTTETCLQFYTGKDFDGSLTGKSERAYTRCAGLCLETEGYPAATTQAGFGDIIVRPGNPQRRITKFAFCHE